MDDLLKPIKTTKKVESNISKFESLSLNDTQRLSHDGTKPKRSIFEIDTTIEEEEPALKAASSKKLPQPTVVKELSSTTHKRHKRQDSTAFLQRSYLKEPAPKSLSDDAREILKSQPCHEDLKAVLEYLQYGIDGRHDFDIRVTGPKSTQIIIVLVTITIPDIWNNLRQKELSADEAQIKKIILTCLTSAAGLGALLAQIRLYSTEGPNHSNKILRVDTISVLAGILHGSKVLLTLLSQCSSIYSKDLQRRLFCQELSNLLAGGRVLSVVAQALNDEHISTSETKSIQWLANGAEYSKWLAKNIVTSAIEFQTTEKESWKFLCDIFKRALSLGQREILVSEIYNSLLFRQRALWTPLHLLLKGLPAHDQRVVFDAILYDLNRNQLNEAKLVGNVKDVETRRVVSGAAALIAGIVQQNEVLEEYLEEWLVVANASYAAIGLASRRALIVVLAKSQGKLETILERSLASFADKLQIQHGSILQQEAYTQTILLAVGSLRKIDPKILKYPSISTLVMRSVSNRLAASVPRARFLGMIVGVAVSRIVDAPDKVLDFGIDELDGDEARQWLELPDTQDKIGNISDLVAAPSPKQVKHSLPKSVIPVTAPAKKTALSQTSKIIAIEEISDSSSGEEEEDPDLIPYGKPDSDAEDSDEDPTLINRSKPSAPVYIVDLIKYLNKTDQLDTIELALKTAPSLIRRKATFGTEVTDNIHSLATSLINLQEGTADPDLQTLRLESLIACVVAKPETIASSFSALYFEGDFSTSQRVTLLSAIGLSAREISGFKDQDDSSKSSSSSSKPRSQKKEEDLFPSKRLPPHLTPQSNPISTLTAQSARSTIQPMAISASDKLSGPSILKIRTFSSRPAVESRTRQKAEARTKSIPKNLSVILTKSFFLPLCCRLSLLLSHVGVSSSNTTLLQPDMVKMALQTLVLILHTLGPVGGSLHLPTLTRETLSLHMALYSLPSLSTDPVVLPAMLHLLLVLIDITVEAGITAQERLITDHGNHVAELVNWASKLGDTISVPDVNDQGAMPWSVLAAGIQVKWFEMGQRFQGRMLGLTGDELDGFS